MAFNWLEAFEITLICILCVTGGILGTSLKRKTHDVAEPFDRRKYTTGLFLGGGAGLVTGLLGYGLKINKSLLIGTSIVVGYSGGRKFFEWIQKLISAATVARLTGREPKISGFVSDDNDDEKDGDPP